MGTTCFWERFGAGFLGQIHISTGWFQSTHINLRFLLRAAIARGELIMKKISRRSTIYWTGICQISPFCGGFLQFELVDMEVS